MIGEDTGNSRTSEIAPSRVPIVLAHEQSFEIGAAEFLPATREVRCEGQTSIIEPRIMKFLVALHRAGGAVVDKEDLLQSCWDGRIVGGDALNRVVSRLRGVAAKEAGGQFRVENITKVGYRLIAGNGQALVTAAALPAATRQLGNRTGLFSQPKSAIAAVALLLLAIVAGGWLLLRSQTTAAHNMIVRLAGYRPLSSGLPADLRESINAEIASAFNVDGVIGVSTAKTTTPGTSPAYALGGTIYRVGESIRVTTRFTNERSGVVLWSDSADYSAGQSSRAPRKIAVDAGTVIRCGLSGAATYGKPLPDSVLSNYMRYCREYWSEGGSKTLRFARLVVAAAPDFSWGWSALGNGYMQAAGQEGDVQRSEALRAAGRQAEDHALRLDPNNSEALAHKAYMIDPHDWIGQEALFKHAIAAKPLDCGCEHYGYGLKLESVGRLGAAIEQFRAATDMLALWPDSQLALAKALVAAGHGNEAKPYFDAFIDLSNNPNADKMLAVSAASDINDYAGAIAALHSPKTIIAQDTRAALSSGYEALSLGGRKRKEQAVQRLLALPKGEQNEAVATLLAALGANREALQVAARRPWLFWRRDMRGVLSEPAFLSVASELGLVTYWKTSRTKPDVCREKNEPAFCRSI